ncbi:MAG: hypothetical protein RIS76_144 [Verrucomicrobiota bacterium]
MEESAPISVTGWENRLISLLREELASSPTRWRATVRLSVLCVVIVAPEFLSNQVSTLHDGLRAMAFQTTGIGLGTLVQVLWWPENPSALLLPNLSESLRSIGQHCRSLASGSSVSATTPPVRSLRTSAARLFRQPNLRRAAAPHRRAASAGTALERDLRPLVAG